VTHLRSTPLLLLAALIVLSIALPGGAATEQVEPDDEPVTLTRTFPRANAVLDKAPEIVTLTFSTDIDPEASDVRVLASDGTSFEGIALDWNGGSVNVALPGALANGSWLVAWRVTALDTEAEGSGFFGFIVGTDQDVAPLTIPDAGFQPPAAASWLGRIGSAALVLGTLVLIAIWPLWSLMLCALPSSASIRARLPGLVVPAAAVAIAGALGSLMAAIWTHPAGTLPERLVAVTGDARPGWVLLVALVLVSLHSVLLAFLPARPNGALGVLPWISTVAVALPVALASHAADEPAGRITTLTVVTIALLTLGLLAGGTIALVWLRVTVPGRMGLLVATGTPALLFCGAYLAWLFIGNTTALAETPYGTLATVTAAVTIALLLALAAAVQLAHRRVPLLVAALLAIVMAGLIGSLMTGETARAQLEREAAQRAVPLTLDGDRAQLILAPGTTGVNHVRLEIDRASLQQQVHATMVLAVPSRPDLGQQPIPLSRVSENAFEYHGTDLALADRWEITVMLAEPGLAPAEGTVAIALARHADGIDVPGTPWRFADFAGTAGVVMVVIGIVGSAVGIAAGRSPLRMEGMGIGVTALALATILLGQGRLDPILAAGGDRGAGAINPDDLTMITRGEQVYADQCLRCHGSDLRGDGPASAGMHPPPADFSQPHAMIHDEATLIYWLRNGKQGTAMPAFDGTLTDDEIRAVLSYIEREQRAFQATEP
jgi:mono/diheme cytochrome c family protein/methionine-rich copper-binding protein CopC